MTRDAIIDEDADYNGNDNGIMNVTDTENEMEDAEDDDTGSSIFSSLAVEMTEIAKKSNKINSNSKSNHQSNHYQSKDKHSKAKNNNNNASTASSSSSLSISSLDDLLPPSKLYAGKRDDVDDDLDKLLGIDMEEFQHREEEKKKMKKQQQRQEKERRSRRIGRTIILSHTFYDKFKCCMVGPHWVGVLFTLSLLTAATYFFTNQALEHAGMISAGLCIVFHIVSTSCLLRVSCVDPGIVRPDDCDQPGAFKNQMNQKKQLTKRRKGTSSNQEYQGLMSSDTQDNDHDHDHDHEYEYGHPHGDDEENTNTNGGNQSRAIRENWRYCAMCNVYQPPTAVHCPECHVCVDGYDHHCPWMGCCIGKRNYKPFMMFNLSWLTYFFYVAIWVSFVGPLVYKKSKGET